MSTEGSWTRFDRLLKAMVQGAPPKADKGKTEHPEVNKSPTNKDGQDHQ